MTVWRRAIPGAIATAVLGLGLTACGSSSSSSSSSSSDPVTSALQTQGVRTVVIPKQRNNLVIAVPPCSEAQTTGTGAKQPPPGSNEIIVPSGALTETLAIQPCAP